MFLTSFYNTLGHWGKILSCYIHFFLEFSRFFAAIMDFMAAIMDFENFFFENQKVHHISFQMSPH